MKTLHKALLVAIVAIFSFGYASADFRFGIKAGLNFNKMDIKNVQGTVSDPGNRTGWQAGVMAEFTIPIVNIGADVSLMYARQNLDKMLVNSENVYNNKDFLDIPVNLKWKIGLPIVGRIISPIIYTGPDFLVALNKNTLKDIQTKKCQVGWNLGIGLELVRHLQVTAGYCFGLNSVAKYMVDTQDLTVKKNYWSVSAAYLF
ncbi:MAG: PorT family protein [Muribaculum sp.]|nr:PorT family protein [Muribaculum sp.]